MISTRLLHRPCRLQRLEKYRTQKTDTLFLSFLFPYLLSNFYRAFLAVVAGDLSRDLGLDAAQLASLQASFLLAFALTQFPVGLSLDRIGPRRALILGLCCAVGGSVLFAYAQHYWQALLAMALLGAGFSPVLMTGFYMIGRSYPVTRFATMTSLLFGLGTLGDPLSGAPLSMAVSHFGWRPTMLAMGGITAASLVCSAIMIRNPPRIAPPGGAISAWESVRQVVSIRALWPLLPVSLATYAVIAAMRGLWIAPYLSQVHHFTPQAVGLCATAMGLAIAFGGLTYAPFNRLLGDAKITVMTGVAGTVVGWLLISLFGEQSSAFTLCLLLIVSALGASFPIVLSHARAFLPSHLLGQGVTMVNLMFFVGAGMGQWVTGRYVRAAELAAVTPNLIYQRLFIGFTVVLTVALAIYLLAPREKRSEKHSGAKPAH